MNNHPEQKKHEDFVGNTKCGGSIPAHLLNLSTARVGNVVYDVHGKKIPDNCRGSYRPLFIGKAESNCYDKIMMSRMRITL